MLFRSGRPAVSGGVGVDSPREGAHAVMDLENADGSRPVDACGYLASTSQKTLFMNHFKKNLPSFEMEV